MPRKHNATGRSRYDGAHVRLYAYMTDSPAFLSLTCAARGVLIEIARRYNGTNNGRLAASVRDLSMRCRIAPGTASRALGELQERGFIECVTRGAFSLKARHASEWRLTWQTCNVTGELAAKPFMSWGREKQKTVSKYSSTVPRLDTASPKSAA